ncbi:MAG: hypothetical protein ACYTFK_12905 [Planctomycetota bacterium]|jgi:hypothetical protein
MSKQEKTNDELIAELYLRRQAAATAKKAHRDKTAEVGSCRQGGSFPPTDACYQDHWPEDQPELCDACKAKQPLWEDYKRKANLAGGALRTLLSRGKHMSEAAK